MACIGTRGELTESALKMLSALHEAATAEIVAERAALPLFRVRAGLREMSEAGLVEEDNGLYTLSQLGSSRLPST